MIFIESFIGKIFALANAYKSEIHIAAPYNDTKPARQMFRGGSKRQHLDPKQKNLLKLRVY